MIPLDIDPDNIPPRIVAKLRQQYANNYKRRRFRVIGEENQYVIFRYTLGLLEYSGWIDDKSAYEKFLIAILCTRSTEWQRGILLQSEIISKRCVMKIINQF